MNPEAVASQYRFEKQRTEAVVRLSSGETVRGFFFTAGGITWHDGPERIGDLLNSEPGFFPFEVQGESGPRIVLHNRAHVVTVALTTNEAERNPGYASATRRFVSVVLSTGDRLTGTIRVYRPEGHNRLSDWARQPEIFRYFETADRTFMFNMKHVVSVSEAPEP
ncbi:MAG: hypothetical protein WBD07_05105 [Vicinamibacterales bacterium]